MIFSTLKYVKNRLRSKLTNENTGALILMSVKKENLMNIDKDQIINLLSQKSKKVSFYQDVFKMS